MASEQLVRDVILRDGSALRLRAPSPADFARLNTDGPPDGRAVDSRRLLLTT
jgi:hypothetical protein